MTALPLTKVVSGLGFPEGPVAMADGSLLFVDIEKQTLCSLSTKGTVSVIASLPGGPNGVAIGPDGADTQDVWIIASGTGTIHKGRWLRPGLKLSLDA